MTGHTRNLRHHRLAAAAIVVLVLGGGGRAFGQAQEDWRLFSKDFVKSFGRDFAAVVTSPLHWHNKDLGRFALVSAATLAVTPFEEDIRDWAQAHKTDSSQDVATFFEHFGNGAYLLGFTIVLYGAGEIWHSQGVRKTALLSLESFATTSAIVQVTKFVVGRARPRTGHNNHKFHPFTTNNEYNAFPSGHTAAAFAVATTIADQTRSVPLDILVYSAATMVGFSRIHDNEHWASSVIAGAALGYFVSKKICRRHRTPEPAKNVDLGFALGSDGLALTLTYVF
jgi:PAP2 superfamily